MQLITAEQRAALLVNGAASTKRDIDHHSVIKLFTPDASATWLLTEPDIRRLMNALDPVAGNAR